MKQNRDIIVKLSRVALIAIFFIGFVPYASAGWLGPSDFKECTNDIVASVGSERAARVALIACNKKFRQKEDLEFADCIIDHIVGTASDVAANAINGACRSKADGKINKFQKCFLDSMKNIKTDLAARKIIGECNRSEN